MDEFCRFDMEHQLQECWRVTDDLRDIHEAMMNGNIDSNRAENALMGIQELYEVKFQKLWSLYELGVRNGNIR